MAVPSSGAIRLDADILVELGQGNEEGGSLSDASRGIIETINTNNAVADRPDGSTPHAMSEFYSYDHSASAGLAGSYGNSSSTIVWSGDQGSSTTAIVDSFDVSSAAFCGQSAIGETGHVYFRIVSTSGYRQDAQILAVNQSGYGYNT